MSKEKVRVRCPCCGMMTDLDRMAELDTDPTQVQVFLQTMGGKTPMAHLDGVFKKVGRGKAPGVMSYQEITGEIGEGQLLTIRKWFVTRAKAFLKEKEG